MVLDLRLNEKIGCRETTFFFYLLSGTCFPRKVKEVQPSFFIPILGANSLFLHFFVKKFAYVRKKQYLCTRFLANDPFWKGG